MSLSYTEAKKDLVTQKLKLFKTRAKVLQLQEYKIFKAQENNIFFELIGKMYEVNVNTMYNIKIYPINIIHLYIYRLYLLGKTFISDNVLYTLKNILRESKEELPLESVLIDITNM